MKKQQKNKNKGITLIALVITIIVLLILVAVVINMLTGENGVLAKARWSEAVSEYGKVDELEKLFVIKNQMNQYGETEKNKPKLSLKSLFTNISYASETIDTIYPIDSNEKVDVMLYASSLHRTICYEENLTTGDLTDERFVNLYKVDFSLLEDSEVKREYVINIVSGMLYWLEPVNYQGLDYHTPRYGVKREEEPEPISQVTIHYLCGYDNNKDSYTQMVDENDSYAVTLNPNQFTRQNYNFYRWKDVTSEHPTSTDDEVGESENNGEGGNTFVKQTEGYFDIANKLTTVFDGNDWETDILEIIEENKEFVPDPKNTEAPQSIEEQTRNEIANYLKQSVEIENSITNLLTSGQSIEDLANWLIGNTDYLDGLKNYEENSSEGESEEGNNLAGSTTSDTYYEDKETNVNMAGMDMWLEAEWADGMVTLDANGGTIYGQATHTIPVKENEPYGTSLTHDPNDIVRSGYVFAGWWTEKSGGTQVIATDLYQASQFTNTNTLYAHWNQETIATITYDACGGTMKGTNLSTKTEQKVISTMFGNLPKIEAKGVEFGSWYTASTGGTKVTANTVVTGSMTLYAQWHKVDLRLNDGILKCGYTNNSGKSKFSEWNPNRDTGIYVTDGEKIGKQKGWDQLPLTYYRWDSQRRYKYIKKTKSYINHKRKNSE